MAEEREVMGWHWDDEGNMIPIYEIDEMAFYGAGEASPEGITIYHQKESPNSPSEE
jgi:hypothetical protein